MGAPIGLFAYNRADYVARALQALARCPELASSPVVIYCDGPKSEAGRARVEAARAAARAHAPAHATLVERPTNLGLARSMRTGVSALCDQYGCAIILEDDLEVSPTFLTFMNAALERYADEPRVLQVSGYMYPVAIDGPDDGLFLPAISCWGWGVWKRAWDKLGSGAELYDRLVADRALRRRFDLGGAFPYFEMLGKQRRGEVDSWGVTWQADVFANDGLVLYPRTSLVANRGHDGSGTHAEASSPFEAEAHAVHVTRWPPARALESEVCAVQRYIRRAHRRQVAAAVTARLRAALARITARVTDRAARAADRG